MSKSLPNVQRISSIGWLHGTNGSINLTPCVDRNAFATFVNISRDEFEKVRDSKDEMKLLAAQRLGL